MQPRILVANPGKPYYEEAVARSGGIPVPAVNPAVSTDYDGLLLCGGADLHPSWYGEEIQGSVGIDPERDISDMALARAFIQAGKPILGICRGHQILNVALGGSLHQHISTAQLHLNTPSDAIHPVITREPGILSRLYGASFTVNSSHHQAIARLGEGLKITQVCSLDGTVEAVEHTQLPILGIQWHPERICLGMARAETVDGLAVFQYFTELCGR